MRFAWFQTMVFMEQLQDYVETAGAMLLMHGELPPLAGRVAGRDTNTLFC